MGWRWQWPWTTPTDPSTPEKHELTPEQHFAQAFEIEGGKRYYIQNRTPRWMRIVDCSSRGDGHSNDLVLSPLGARVMSGWRLIPFEDEIRMPRQRHQLRVREYCDDSSRHPLLRWFARLPARLVLPAVAVCLAVAADALVAHGTLQRPLLVWSVAIASILVIVMLVVASVYEARRRRDAVWSDNEEGDIDFGVGGSFYDGNDTLRHTKHLLALAAVIVTGVVLPAVTIFLATDAKDFIVIDGGLAVVEGRESRLVGRMIQVTYTALLSIFPALLYFQFDLHRVGTIRAEWVRAIFRLDRRMETLADVNARYGDDLSEASSYSTDSARFLGGRNSPIVIATILVALGWTLLVVPTASFDFAGAAQARALAQTAEQASARAGSADDLAEAEAARTEADEALAAADRVLEESTGITSPSTSTTDAGATGSMDEEAEAAAASADSVAAVEARIDQPFFQLLDPSPSAAAMAFLGAYFFGIYLLLRSYFRGDLRPKMYNQITARLVTVVVLAYLINALFFDQLDGPNRMVWALSFLAGIVPTTVLQQIGRLLSQTVGAFGDERNKVARAFETTFSNPRALTQVDGIDIHDSTRLETEGITDIPSLAKGDLVSMMVKTRLPVPRLIDWADQALLIVHLDGPGDDLDHRVVRLRRVGIRTASAVVAAAQGRIGIDAVAVVEEILTSPPPEEEEASATRPGFVRRQVRTFRGWQARRRDTSDGTTTTTTTVSESAGVATTVVDARDRVDVGLASAMGPVAAGSIADGTAVATNGASDDGDAPCGNVTLTMLAAQLLREPALMPIRAWRGSQHLDSETRSVITIPEGAGPPAGFKVAIDLREEIDDIVPDLTSMECR